MWLAIARKRLPTWREVELVCFPKSDSCPLSPKKLTGADLSCMDSLTTVNFLGERGRTNSPVGGRFALAGQIVRLTGHGQAGVPIARGSWPANLRTLARQAGRIFPSVTERK
jgi:hypothetical protein